MFNANAPYSELKQEIASISEAFSASPVSPFDFFIRFGNYFCGVDSARCAIASYDLAARCGVLPDSVSEWLGHIKKSPFLDKMFVITGELSLFERDEALSLIRKFGGLTSDNPVNTMDYLVLGSQEWSAMNNGVASRKVQKAADLKAKGKNIEIISEDDFYSLLSSCESLA